MGFGTSGCEGRRGCRNTALRRAHCFTTESISSRSQSSRIVDSSPDHSRHCSTPETGKTIIPQDLSHNLSNPPPKAHRHKHTRTHPPRRKRVTHEYTHRLTPRRSPPCCNLVLSRSRGWRHTAELKPDTAPAARWRIAFWSDRTLGPATDDDVLIRELVLPCRQALKIGFKRVESVRSLAEILSGFKNQNNNKFICP